MLPHSLKMLRLKQKKAEAAAAALAEKEEAALMEVDPADEPLQSNGTENENPKLVYGKVSLMGGIGGKKIVKSADKGKKKRTPGEIRIQKGKFSLTSANSRAHSRKQRARQQRGSARKVSVPKQNIHQEPSSPIVLIGW